MELKCTGCSRNFDRGDKSCPIKELYPKRSKLEDHDCGAVRPWSRRARENFLRVEVEQGTLF